MKYLFRARDMLCGICENWKVDFCKKFNGQKLKFSAINYNFRQNIVLDARLLSNHF